MIKVKPLYKPQLSKLFKDIVLKDLTIHRWELEQKEKRSKMKI